MPPPRREGKIEVAFYRRYRAFRERLYGDIVRANPAFPGSPRRLVELTQKILDRLVFLLYCEDMAAGPAVSLRPLLLDQSCTLSLHPEGTEVWARVKRLFAVMQDAGTFLPDVDLSGLILPNAVFCSVGQGIVPDDPSLLSVIADYHFGDQGDGENALGLQALSHIFEQSVTDLERLEAAAEGRSLAQVPGRRKRDGVYYTSAVLVGTIVAETMAPRLAELRRESGWQDDAHPTLIVLDTYRAKLAQLKILDPACGAGVFLIAAFHYLYAEFRRVDQLRREIDPTGHGQLDAEIVASILCDNIYGVDLSPAAVDIAKLMLWLHAARSTPSLLALDGHILSGNSLSDTIFFPDVAAAGGFDIVLGNPPYVKLQNFKAAYPEVAEHLRSGEPRYESVQTGNFDLYLPFIEKGLSLLNDRGRLGVIAPSLWLMNDYGKGLRRLIHRNRALDRWVDFKSHQNFDAATTYTALQFFTRRPNEAIRLFPAPTGELSALRWDDEDLVVSYDDLQPDDSWHLLPRNESALMAKLAQNCRRLDDARVTKGIIVGLQTSADRIYHLKRLGPNRYLARGEQKGDDVEVALEDAVMKPLVSGANAKRYTVPATDTYLLFPYDIRDGRAQLIAPELFAQRYPKAWGYLQSHEAKLRRREKGSFDDAEWYRFGRRQNLEKQDRVKLIVPRLVTKLEVSLDAHGTYYLDNVDVGAVLPAESVDPAFLLAVLNGPVVTFVFRRISKPFRGGYYSANKQFIAPLPIPLMDSARMAAIASKAHALQEAHSTSPEIARLEAEINVDLYQAYQLTPSDIALVERG